MSWRTVLIERMRETVIVQVRVSNDHTFKLHISSHQSCSVLHQLNIFCYLGNMYSGVAHTLINQFIFPLSVVFEIFISGCTVNGQRYRVGERFTYGCNTWCVPYS